MQGRAVSEPHQEHLRASLSGYSQLHVHAQAGMVSDTTGESLLKPVPASGEKAVTRSEDLSPVPWRKEESTGWSYRGREGPPS